MKKTIRLFLTFAAMFVFGMGMEFYDDVIKPFINPSPSPTPLRFPSPRPTLRPTSRPLSTPTPEEADCLHWSEVTADMVGTEQCVYGVIVNFTSSKKLFTRYEFSDKPNTFFLFSRYEIFGIKNGKTVGIGKCVGVVAVIELQAGVPSVNIDKLIEGDELVNFVFYEDVSVCEK